MVNKHIRTSTNGYLPGSLIDSNRLEGIRIVDVDRLEELLRTAEDDQCMAGDVRLPRTNKHISNGYFRPDEKLMSLTLTTTRIPSHNVVLKDWSFAGGLPGRTARIEAVIVGSKRCVRREV